MQGHDVVAVEHDVQRRCRSASSGILIIPWDMAGGGVQGHDAVAVEHDAVAVNINSTLGHGGGRAGT